MKDKTRKRKKGPSVTLAPLAPLGFAEAVKTLLSVPPPLKKKRRKRP